MQPNRKLKIVQTEEAGSEFGRKNEKKTRPQNFFTQVLRIIMRAHMQYLESIPHKHAIKFMHFGFMFNNGGGAIHQFLKQIV